MSVQSLNDSETMHWRSFGSCFIESLKASYTWESYWRSVRVSHTLHIESLDHTGNIYNKPLSRPRLERSSVVSITPKGIRIEQAKMKAILEQHGQHLEKLHIIAAGRISYPSPIDLTLPYVETFDRRDFYQIVARSCPKINSFHFSFFKPDPLWDSPDVLMDAFPAL